MSEDPTLELFKPVASIKLEYKLCLPSYKIGMTEMAFLYLRTLPAYQIQSYLNLCIDLNHRPDNSIIDYAKQVYDYKFENGIHIVQ